MNNSIGYPNQKYNVNTEYKIFVGGLSDKTTKSKL